MGVYVRREAYPTNNGIPVSPLELGITTQEEIEEARINGTLTIHHHGYPYGHYQGARKVSIDEIDTPLAVIRNLNSWQSEVPAHQHNHGGDTLHTRFEPPQRPSRRQTMAYIWDAYLKGDDPIVLGSINNREYHPLTEELMCKLIEYNPRVARQAMGSVVVRNAQREGRLGLDLHSVDIQNGLVAAA